MNRFALSLVALGALLAGPALAQTTAGAGASAHAMAPATSSTASRPMGRPAAASAATMAPVNVNTATAAQLDAIPQIGPKRAQKIIANRPYTVPSDMVTKKALSQGIFDKIKANVTTG